ncbi:hypothetical protein BDY24DRAFT_415221 [Mrakia frigida]|uniref:uncharacterized protein n=1 Tax=Mrakia frigida TaxID=29902 RepID=UPI003FCC0D82
MSPNLDFFVNLHWALDPRPRDVSSSAGSATSVKWNLAQLPLPAKMPIYTSLDFAALHKTSFTLQQQQWSQTFSKPLASKHINEWRAFRDNSIYSYSNSSSSSPPPPSSLLPGSNNVNSTNNEPSPRLAGIVGDAKTYAEAAKAVRVFLDEDFHTFKTRTRTLPRHHFSLRDKSLNKDLLVLYDKRAALESEIANLEVSLNALSEVKAGAVGR